MFNRLSETGLMASMMMEEEQVPRDVFGLEDASIHVDNPKRKKRTMSSVTGSAVGTPGRIAHTNSNLKPKLYC